MIEKFFGLLVAAWIGAIGALGPAHATPAKEAPWLPEAAAYRLTLFLGNLEPIPWDKVETAWSDPYHGSEFSGDALAWLSANSDISAEPLLGAIVRKDRHALFEAATQTIAYRIEEELDRALNADDPATAQQAVQTARELYRAFADGVAAADPAGARQIGRAWLELNNSTGSAGVLGAGATPADKEAMNAARVTISRYLAENYLLDDFAPRRQLTPLPETAILGGRDIDLPPSLPPGADIFDQDPLPLLVLNFEEQGIDETDLPLIAYGDMLFDSAQIFGGPRGISGSRVRHVTTGQISISGSSFLVPVISLVPSMWTAPSSIRSSTTDATIRSISPACAACGSLGPMAAMVASRHCATLPAM